MGTQEERGNDAGSVIRRTALFSKYILPNINMVYKLCIKYSFDKASIRDNYNECLANFYRYMDTYDENKSIQTWIHIIVKRFLINHERDKRRLKSTDDVLAEELEDELETDNKQNYKYMTPENYRVMYSDDVLWALDQLKPIYKDALILQQAGHNLKEIVEICYQNGTLDSKNMDTIKSRLFLARQQLQTLLTRDGKRRSHEKNDNPLL